LGSSRPEDFPGHHPTKSVDAESDRLSGAPAIIEHMYCLSA
jgi:hypothetical protein